MVLKLLLFLSIPFLLFSQEKPKQITNFDFDSRNPSFSFSVGFFEEPRGFLFEGWNDTICNIYSLTYDLEADSFKNLTKLSDNNTINKKAVLNHYNENQDLKIAIWETNKNGNWDIVISKDSGYGWSKPEFVSLSEEDEFDPSFIVMYYGAYPYGSQIAFSRGNSIVLYSLIDSSEEIIFKGSDSVKFSNPALANFDGASLIAAAERRQDNGEPYLVYINKYYGDSLWSEINVINTGKPAINPKFLNTSYPFILSYEVLNDKKKYVNWKNDYYMENEFYYSLYEDESIETSNFSSFYWGVITKKIKYFDSSLPYAFKLKRNDSVFVQTGADGKFELNFRQDYTRVLTANPDIGMLALDEGSFISYAIWEDSSNGRVNLFGNKRVDRFTDIPEENIPRRFSLSQNYPNPFNPSTTIKYSVPYSSNIELKIYDVLGKEVAILVNEEKPMGEYEIEFNASELSSGVYFYTLKAGAFAETKKLLMLK